MSTEESAVLLKPAAVMNQPFDSARPTNQRRGDCIVGPVVRLLVIGSKSSLVARVPLVLLKPPTRATLPICATKAECVVRAVGATGRFIAPVPSWISRPPKGPLAPSPSAT